MSLAILFQLLCAQYVSDINILRNNTQEKQTHYFKWPLTPSPHIPHEQNSCASACKTNTTKYQPQQKLEHTTN